MEICSVYKIGESLCGIYVSGECDNEFDFRIGGSGINSMVFLIPFWRMWCLKNSIWFQWNIGRTDGEVGEVGYSEFNELPLSFNEDSWC